MGNIESLGFLQMNEQELLAVIGFSGRYEIISDGRGGFTCVPVPSGAVLILPESHEECLVFFRRKDD